MRILYVSQYYPPEMGAPSSRVSQMARAWASEGHDVAVLTGFPNHPTGVVPPEYRGWPYARREDDHGVTVLRTPIYAAANKGFAKRVANYVSFAGSAATVGLALSRLWSGKPDVVIGTSPQFLTAVAASAIAKAHRVPFVFEVRDLWPRSIVEVGAMPADSAAVKALYLMESALYRDADRIVAVTDSFVDEIAAKGIPREKIVVVKNGVDLDMFRPGPKNPELREKLGLSGKFVAAYVGTHGLAHGLGTILDAAALLKARGDSTVQFLLIGEGADKAALVERAGREGLTNVTFLGQQPHAAIPELLRAADATLVLLKGKDLFKTVIPSKIFEFMGVARPIVLGVDGEARGLVEASGGGVFCPPESAADLVEKLQELQADPARCERMGQSGRKYVERHFSRAALARDYLAHLDALLERRAAA